MRLYGEIPAPATVQFLEAGETSFFGRFLFYDPNATSTVTNAGVLWNRITGATADGNTNVAVMTFGAFVNSGKVVIELAIAPSGAVSSVKLVSSELKSPDLEQKLLARFRLLDFKPEDVDTLITTYPIDFLPS